MNALPTYNLLQSCLLIRLDTNGSDMTEFDKIKIKDNCLQAVSLWSFIESIFNDLPQSLEKTLLIVYEYFMKRMKDYSNNDFYSNHRITEKWT